MKVFFMFLKYFALLDIHQLAPERQPNSLILNQFRFWWKCPSNLIFKYAKFVKIHQNLNVESCFKTYSSCVYHVQK